MDLDLVDESYHSLRKVPVENIVKNYCKFYFEH
jgi:hypothetical protein